MDGGFNWMLQKRFSAKDAQKTLSPDQDAEVKVFLTHKDLCPELCYSDSDRGDPTLVSVFCHEGFSPFRGCPVYFNLSGLCYWTGRCGYG